MGLTERIGCAVEGAWKRTGELTGKVKEGAVAVHDTLVGAEIARAVESYSTVYGEVLLGMHRDLEKAKADIEAAHRKIRLQNRLLWFSCSMSLVALVVAGYALWIRG